MNQNLINLLVCAFPSHAHSYLVSKGHENYRIALKPYVKNCCIIQC